ncbi:hypothetical protein PYJP_03950 [Pyrofollis japonicus]|uniref:hypothetical protein n=1 Tax=Pyrofollis japonicus TaxID=3060460 RepID=UPI00295C1133|nr:hypothetical protein [Pyrofollis japonicus]BEP17043.1 hypothetical protein PYJP_03950 [Pyrofollis japonicus]
MGSLDFYTVYVLSVMLLSVVMIIYMVITVLGSRKKDKEEQKVVTVLKCPQCGYVKKREFREGDFIGKIVDEKCPHCGVNLVVDAIYAETYHDIRSALREKRRQKNAS